jgi:hypothetical protein
MTVKYLVKKNKFVIVYIVFAVLMTIILFIFIGINIRQLIKNVKFNKKYFKTNYDYSLFTNNCYYSKPISIKTDSTFKYVNNIPISYYDSTTKTQVPFNICQFFYPGSYNTFLSGDPTKGIYTMESIKYAINKFKCRVLHFDIYKDNSNNPIIRNKYLNNYKPLNFLDVLNLINLNCWSVSKYPMLIYLTFNFNAGDETYTNTAKTIMKVFGNYLLPSTYSYNCRNMTNQINTLTMQSAIGKIIFISNIYPTNSKLDEIINLYDSSTSESFNNITNKTSSTTLNSITTDTTKTNSTQYNNFYLKTYNDSFNKSSVGLLLEYSATTLTTNSTNSLLFFYNSNISPIANPNSIDCNKYGIQCALMYLSNIDNNMYNWYNFFANGNNGNPILKPAELRVTATSKTTVLTTETISPSQTGGFPGFMEFKT